MDPGQCLVRVDQHLNDTLLWSSVLISVFWILSQRGGGRARCCVVVLCWWLKLNWGESALYRSLYALHTKSVPCRRDGRLAKVTRVFAVYLQSASSVLLLNVSNFLYQHKTVHRHEKWTCNLECCWQVRQLFICWMFSQCLNRKSFIYSFLQFCSLHSPCMLYLPNAVYLCCVLSVGKANMRIFSYKYTLEMMDARRMYYSLWHLCMYRNAEMFNRLSCRCV